MQITRHNEPIATLTNVPEVGHQLPYFTVTDAAGKSRDLAKLLGGKLTLISVVPDVNTRVCSIQTQKFNHAVDQFSGINFYTISTNTAADQQSWCAAEGVKSMELLSDANFDFGKQMNLLMAGANVDARSVWVVRPDGLIMYRQVLAEMTDEPDYAAALAAVKALLH